MKRRDFLKLAGVTGAGLALPLTPSLRLFAADDGYTGPLWLTIDAKGGWDPTSFCDPKGYTNPTDSKRLNNYPASAIGEIGNIRYAPPPDSFASDTSLYTNKQFFEKYFQDLLIINGIDCKTISHSNGQRQSWGGSLDRLGYPNFGALVARALAPSKPISFITNGGYSVAPDPLVPTRLNSKNITSLYEIAYTNRAQDVKDPNSGLYFPEGGGQALDLIKSASAARQQSLLQEQQLPNIRNALENFIASKTDVGHLKDFAANLDVKPEKPLSFFNGRKKAQKVYQQGRTALVAYESGATSAAHLSLDGFDTHSDHDAKHYPLLMDFLQGIDAIIEEAKERNLADRLVIVVGSDFGRTNKYNGKQGKNHWPITSMMFMGNSQQVIRGNRVVGSTTDLHKGVNINPDSLLSDPGGVRLRPLHIHRALRRLAGVSDSATTLKYPLDGLDLNLL